MLFARSLLILFFSLSACLTHPLAHSQELPWPPAELIKSQQGLVASESKLASQVGQQIMQQGGNAIDAAVATGYALAVTLPEAGNLGGGGFMLIHLAENKKTFAINYRETAPKKAHRDMFLDENGQPDASKSLSSLQATGVPGTVAAFDAIQQRYGQLSRAAVMAPAIKLAEAGFILEPKLAGFFDLLQERLARSPDGRKIFFDKKGKPRQAGTIWRQADLAQSLKAIAAKGEKAFYQGDIAHALVTDMKNHGGLISHEDLQAYQIATVKPLMTDFHGYQIASMPPPSSGGIALIQLLEILEPYPLKAQGFHHADSIHYLVEAMNYVYADRSEFLGDPNFTPVPVKQLLSQQHIKKIRANINRKRHQPSKEINPKAKEWLESDSTTHFSVVDKAGNMVSNTYTLNSYFGNGHVVTGTGILLNNEMDDFSAKPGVPNQFGVIGGKANEIAPRKQPLSSMSPTLVLDKSGHAILATGSPGGSRIITTVLQALLNTLVFDMDIATAIDMPRFHSQWTPDNIRLEVPLPSKTQKSLTALGHQFSLERPMGAVQTVAKEDSGFLAASDTRHTIN